jgi:hypothetical protein
MYLLQCILLNYLNFLVAYIFLMCLITVNRHLKIHLLQKHNKFENRLWFPFSQSQQIPIRILSILWYI